MTFRRTVLVACLVAASTAAYSQSPGFEFRAQAIKYSPEISTIQCSKGCVIKLKPAQKVRFEADRITSNRATGEVTLQGSIRLVMPDSEAFADNATVTTDSDGTQYIRSNAIRIVSPSIRNLASKAR